MENASMYIKYFIHSTSSVCYSFTFSRIGILIFTEVYIYKFILSKTFRLCINRQLTKNFYNKAKKMCKNRREGMSVIFEISFK